MENSLLVYNTLSLVIKSDYSIRARSGAPEVSLEPYCLNAYDSVEKRSEEELPWSEWGTGYGPDVQPL